MVIYYYHNSSLIGGMLKWKLVGGGVVIAASLFVMFYIRCAAVCYNYWGDLDASYYRIVNVLGGFVGDCYRNC
jgi:hypothetical protein